MLPGKEERVDLWSSKSTLMMAVAAYIVVQPTVILLNWYVLKKVGFHYPVMVSSAGIFTSWLMTFLLVHSGTVSISKEAKSMPKIWLRILPVGLCAAVSMATGNIAYLYISVPLIQMMKALTPVVTMLALFSVRFEKPTVPLVSAISLLSVGAGIACYGEVKFVWMGFIAMIMSVFSQAARMVYAQHLLSNFKMSVWDGLYYFSPMTLAFMSLFIIFFELPALLEDEGITYLIANLGWLTCCGFAGFLLNFIIFSVVKTAGSLTLNMLVIMDNIIVVTFSFVFLDQHISLLQGLGYSVAMMGNVLYVWIRLAPKGQSEQGYSRAKGTDIYMSKHSNAERNV